MTVPTIPTQERSTWYAWTLQRYVNVPAELKVWLKVVSGTNSTGGGPGGRFGLESHATPPPGAGPAIGCGSVGLARPHGTIVPCTPVMFPGAIALPPHSEAP